MMHGPRLLEILLIEKVQQEIDLIIDVLAKARIANRVHVVKDGMAALRFLRREEAYRNAIQPDVVLLSVNVPCVDGREVLAEIKTSADLKHFPVFLLSNEPSTASDFLTKPAGAARSQQIVQAIERFWFEGRARSLAVTDADAR